MIREYEVTGNCGIMPKDEIYKPGDTVELDDRDARVKEWFADGCLGEIGTNEKAEIERLQAELDKAQAAAKAAQEKVAERKKPGPKPKDKEGE